MCQNSSQLCFRRIFDSWSHIGISDETPKNVLMAISEATDLYSGPQLSQQTKIHHGKFKFTAANSNSPRQIQIRHGKFKFTAANSNSPRQIKIHHTANFKFTVANSNSPRQIQIRRGKLKFTTANLKYTAANSNSPRQIQKSLLTVRFAIGVGPVLRGFWLVLVVCVSFCGGLRGLLGFGGG